MSTIATIVDTRASWLQLVLGVICTLSVQQIEAS